MLSEPKIKPAPRAAVPIKMVDMFRGGMNCSFSEGDRHFLWRIFSSSTAEVDTDTVFCRNFQETRKFRWNTRRAIELVVEVLSSRTNAIYRVLRKIIQTTRQKLGSASTNVDLILASNQLLRASWMRPLAILNTFPMKFTEEYGLFLTPFTQKFNQCLRIHTCYP